MINKDGGKKKGLLNKEQPGKDCVADGAKLTTNADAAQAVLHTLARYSSPRRTIVLAADAKSTLHIQIKKHKREEPMAADAGAIVAAYEKALAAYPDADIETHLAAVFRLVPNAGIEEVVDALRQVGMAQLREAEQLESYFRGKEEQG
jgi:hypothetical protein